MNPEEKNPEEKKRLWMAYVDGELSAKDVLSFTASLSEEERSRLEGERRFEAELGRTLKRDSSCPPGLWADLRPRLAVSRGRKLLGFPVGLTMAGAVAAAAAVLLFVWLWPPGGPGGLLDLPPVSELAALSETDSSLEEIRNYLATHFSPSLDLTLPGNVGGHSIELIGVRTIRYGQEEITEVLAQCCDKPIRVVLAPSDTRVAAELRASRGSGPVQAVRDLNGYTLVAVSEHPVENVLSIFN